MVVQRTPKIVIAGTLSLLIAGCTGGDGYETVTPEAANKPVDSHGHGGGHHHGPNGGEIIEVGDHDIHAEVVYDAEHDQITIHILGADAKTEHPIAVSELSLTFAHGDEVEEFKLAAVPGDGESDGKSSKFTLSSKDLMHELAEHSEGAKLVFSVDGKDYSGTVLADPHADHESHDDGDHGESHSGENAHGGNGEHKAHDGEGKHDLHGDGDQSEAGVKDGHGEDSSAKVEPETSDGPSTVGTDEAPKASAEKAE